MALSYNEFTSAGTTACNLSWSFLLRAHVKVYKNRDRLADTGTLLSETTHYTWTGASQITLATAITSGEVVTIERQTPGSAQLSPWTDGSNLTAEALNNADLQNLYVVQEQSDSNDLGATKAIAATTASNTATQTATTATNTADAAKLATDTYVHDGTSLKGDGVGSNPQGLAYGITTADNAKNAADAAKLATDTYVHDGTNLKGDGVGSNPQGVKYAVDTATSTKTTVETYVHDGTNVKGDGVGSNPQGLAYGINTANTAKTAVDTYVHDGTNLQGDGIGGNPQGLKYAITTADNASATATTALNNSRESDGSGGYTTAISKAGTAKTAADAAKLASDRLVATTSNGGTSWTLAGNNTNASTDPKGVGYAVTTAESAQSAASSASAIAINAQNAVSASVLYSPVTNVSSIPGSPSDGDYIEIADSTGIESFSPLASLPSGFTGDSGLTVRLKYTTSGTTWNYLSYFANDSEDRYLGVYGKHNPSIITYHVKVITKTAAHKEQGNGSSNGYTIGGIEAPHLELIPGNTYRFDQSDSSNVGHPIAFYKKRDKSNSAYTTGVSTTGSTPAGSSGSYTDITISDETPGYLHYQCQNHAYMGGSINANTASGGGAINDWLYENAQTVSESYTITSNKNAMAVGPVALNSSVVITIPNNSVLLIH